MHVAGLYEFTRLEKKCLSMEVVECMSMKEKEMEREKRKKERKKGEGKKERGREKNQRQKRTVPINAEIKPATCDLLFYSPCMLLPSSYHLFGSPKGICNCLLRMCHIYCKSQFS